MKLLFLLPLLLGFSVPANATDDLHPLDMKLEQKGFSSLIAQFPDAPDLDSSTPPMDGEDCSESEEDCDDE